MHQVFLYKIFVLKLKTVLMKPTFLMFWLMVFLSPSTHLMGQWSVHFASDDFPFQPPWFGDTIGFVRQSTGLVSRMFEPNQSFFIATPPPSLSLSVNDTIWWELSGRLDFNPSSANYVDWYLMGDSLQLSTSATCVFVRIGNTADEVALYIKRAHAPPVKVIDGRDKVFDRSANPFWIRVVRNPNGLWELWLNDQGVEREMILEGVFPDSNSYPHPYMGLWVRQSTASFFGKHHFYHMYYGRNYKDSIPPQLLEATFLHREQLILTFDKQIQPLDIGQLQLLSDPVFKVKEMKLDDTRQRLTVQLRRPVKPMRRYDLRVYQACDSLWNCLDTTVTLFPVFPIPPKPFNVLIHEIMAIPNPPLGLPPHQFVELRNVTQEAMNLEGMRLCDRQTCATLTSFTLLPDSLLLLCANDAVNALSNYGSVMGLRSFPSLNKHDEDLMLYDNVGLLIHRVSYSSDWYGDALRKEGGFSLEMKDVSHPCGQKENWIGSRDESGGTPGKPNSLHHSFQVKSPPMALNAYPIDSSRVEIRFNKWLHPLQEVTAVMLLHGQIMDYPLLHSVDYQRLIFDCRHPMEKGQVYDIRVEGVKDCVGNTADQQELLVGLPAPSSQGQVRINEILFHPPAGLKEYLELVNIGEQVIDLKDIRIGNLSDSGSIRETVHPFPEGLLLLPGMYACMSASGWDICSKYPCLDSSRVFSISRLPSFPSTKGGVVVLSSDGKVLDSMLYRQQMHSPLLRDKKGVSLERISVTHASLHPSNWTSASGSSFYGTPGYLNSHSSTDPVKRKEYFILESDCYYPGHDKQGLVHYELPQSGYILRMMIFDAQGAFVDSPIRGLSLSAKGTFKWDGQCHNDWCPNGIYVLLFEAFHPNGGVAQSKAGINMIRH
jgi:hypothetical protein